MQLYGSEEKVTEVMNLLWRARIHPDRRRPRHAANSETRASTRIYVTVRRIEILYIPDCLNYPPAVEQVERV